MSSSKKLTAIMMVVATLALVICGELFLRLRSEIKAARDETQWIAHKLHDIEIGIESLREESQRSRFRFDQFTMPEQSAPLITQTPLPTPPSTNRDTVRLQDIPGGNPWENVEAKQAILSNSIAAITASIEKHAIIVQTARSNLDHWISALNVSDEIAAVDVVDGLKLPSLTVYRPYFEARKEWEQMDQFVSILRRKLQYDRLALEIDAQNASGDPK